MSKENKLKKIDDFTFELTEISTEKNNHHLDSFTLKFEELIKVRDKYSEGSEKVILRMGDEITELQNLIDDIKSLGIKSKKDEGGDNV